MPRRDGQRIWKILKKIYLSSDHGVEKLMIKDWTMQADNWASAIWAKNGVLCHRVEGFFFLPLHQVPTSEDQLRSKIPRDVPNVRGVVSIVWKRKTFKNCVSLLVSKKVNKTISTTESPGYLYCVVCICIRAVYNIDRTDERSDVRYSVRLALTNFSVFPCKN